MDWGSETPRSELSAVKHANRIISRPEEIAQIQGYKRFILNFKKINQMKYKNSLTRQLQNQKLRTTEILIGEITL